MTDKITQAHADESNMEKDPDQWVTGDEPMTGAQRSYLKTLSEEAKVPFDDHLTKAEASKRIEELQAKTGRGKPQAGDSEPGGLISSDRTGNPASPREKHSRGPKALGVPHDAAPAAVSTRAGD